MAFRLLLYCRWCYVVLFIVSFVRFLYFSIVFLVVLLRKARGRGWELLFWLFTGALDGGGRESSLEAVCREVVFASVTTVAVVLVSTTQLIRVLLLPSAAFCRLVGL